jgi:hypothetical protein
VRLNLGVYMTSLTALDVQMLGGIAAVGGVIGAAATPLLKTSWKQNVASGIAFGAVFTAGVTAGVIWGKASSLDVVPVMLGSLAIATVAGIFAARQISPAISLKQRAISTSVIGLATVGLVASVPFVCLLPLIVGAGLLPGSDLSGGGANR